MYGIGDDDEDEAEPMMYGDEVSGPDDYSDDGEESMDNSGVGGQPLYKDDLKPKKMKGSQVAANPLWKRIATGVANAYLPPVLNPSTYQQPGTNAGAGNIVSDLVTNYLRKRTPDDPGYQTPDPGTYDPVGGGGGESNEGYLGYAFGGVAGPGSFAGKNTGHHPYGKKGMPQGMFHSKGLPKISTGMPKMKLVTKPHVMKLGSKVPQAVIPLTRRAKNKVNVEDIPELMSKYGV